MSSSHLTPEQRERADQILEGLRARGDEALRELAELLATKQDHELLGRTEFEVRDLVHELGARAIETAAATRRKKGGTEGPA